MIVYVLRVASVTELLYPASIGVLLGKLIVLASTCRSNLVNFLLCMVWRGRRTTGETARRAHFRRRAPRHCDNEARFPRDDIISLSCVIPTELRDQDCPIRAPGSSTIFASLSL